MIEVAVIAKEIYDSGKRLEKSGDSLFKLAEEMARSEQEYRKALSVEILKLRDDKVQATLIPDIARGNTSELKFKRDLAEARWVSAKQNVDAIKSQMNGLQSILKYQTEVE